VLRYVASGVLGTLALTGCGGSMSTDVPSTASATTAPPPASATTTAPPTAAAVPSPLTGEAQSAATGDIPDNQVFLTYRNTTAGYSMKYPEGWALRGTGSQVTFRDKNNIVRIVVERGPPPTPASGRRDLAGVRSAHVTSGPEQIMLSGRPALKVVYTTESAANAVTGKRVTLVVDRYYVWQRGRRAVLDLGTPQGVDNVDAYRMMSESFRWR